MGYSKEIIEAANRGYRAAQAAIHNQGGTAQAELFFPLPPGAGNRTGAFPHRGEGRKSGSHRL